MRRLLLGMLLMGGIGWGATGAWAQQPTGMNSNNRTPFAATGYARPTVSPYVNLGINSNGVSNYQTLVRPMIDERQALERQNATLSQLQQRMGGQAPQGNSREQAANGRPGVRFQHYSHYFGTVR